MPEEEKQVVVFTDGAAEPNPGPGGYGAVLLFGNERKELSGSFRLTTNNRMEVLAAIKALEAVKEPCTVTLYSDSKYLVNAMSKGWVTAWKNAGWVRKKGSVVNLDLWKRLSALCAYHSVTFEWIKGHAGNRENERCDELSLGFLQEASLPADEEYEKYKKEGLKPPSTSGGEYRETKLPIKAVGDLCRKCSTPVEKKIPKRKRKLGQEYYFEYYLFCPGCRTMYVVDDAKRRFEDNPSPTLL